MMKRTSARARLGNQRHARPCPEKQAEQPVSRIAEIALLVLRRWLKRTGGNYQRLDWDAMQAEWLRQLTGPARAEAEALIGEGPLTAEQLDGLREMGFWNLP
jgi:hypothetical protein